MQKILLIIFFFCSFLAYSTHNRAGEITYTQTGPNTIVITVTTYTKASSEADRPKINIIWGDGKTQEIARDNNYPQLFSNDININKYTASHTFPSSGEFTIGFEDANRNADVVNIPNSVELPFYIESKIFLNPFLGSNSSPTLFYAPIDDACLGKVYLHNPGAFDADGDVLKYSLVDCKGTGGLPIGGYTMPAGISIDANTGEIIWNTPNQLGEFNIAFVIEEYRNGYKIGSILRDMQVTVKACPNNNPPQIKVFQDVCVEAGDTVSINVKAVDPNLGDSVVLTAVSGMFSMNPAPTFNQPFAAKDSVEGLFQWMPTCAQVRTQPYSVLFKARDNGSPVNLFDLKTLNIKVIAPAPKNLIANSSNTFVQLNWNAGYCNMVAGYKIYRKENSSTYTPDTCETGMPAGLGYSLLKTTTDTNTLFTDSTSILGKYYCYRVIAYFSNGAESKVSQEVCIELKKVVPAIINVSINNTDVMNGSVFVRWTKASELDLIAHLGPHSYKVYRNNGVLIKTINNVNDTSVVDTLVNTLSNQNNYYVEIWNETPGNSYLIGTSAKANSPFLSIAPMAKSLKLTWNAQIPWTNDTTYIFKESAPNSGVFNIIDTVMGNSFTDKNLINGKTYCYKIQTSGKYSSAKFPSPLLNYSQKICAEPIDTVAPCAPPINVVADCGLNENSISWKKPADSCADDLASYRLYYKDELNKPYTILKSFNANDTFTLHSNLNFVAGCYYLSAIDSMGNESKMQNEKCVENCPFYKLPNVFTPNDDGQNEYFKPFPYKHIEKIKIDIYDRWGLLMFSTTNIDIMWDGRFAENNQMCAAGTYYYICEVYQKKLAGTEKIILKGYVQLIK